MKDKPESGWQSISLAILADTPFSRRGKDVFGFGPTITEYNFLASKFKRVTIFSFEHQSEKNNSSFEKIDATNIQLILLPRIFWGTDLLDKLNVIVLFPVIIFLIVILILTHKVIHTRGPSSIAFLGILLSFVFREKKWWHKFAGNWKQDNAPFFYELQRNLLRQAKHSLVSVNGTWQDSPTHIKAFINPCLFDSELRLGRETLQTKTYNPPYSLVFVGRIEEEKGIFRILDALAKIEDALIEGVYFWGGGKNVKEFESRVKDNKKIRYLGYGKKPQIVKTMLHSHFLLLPSLASEGFPKVIAEGMAFGCLPVVSNVSSIPHYLNDVNSYLWNPQTEDYYTILNKALHDLNKKEKAIRALGVAEQFTYTSYWMQLNNELNLSVDS